MLFDTNPIEDQDLSPKRKTRKRQAAQAAADASSRPSAPSVAYVTPPALGRLDGLLDCHRCFAACMDICDEAGAEWLVECCFCGLKQWTAGVKGHLKPRAEVFVFRDGRFAGRSIEEAAAEPRGMDYIAWAAKEHKRQSVREACEKYLLTASASVG